MSVKFLARGNNGNLLVDFKLTTDNLRVIRFTNCNTPPLRLVLLIIRTFIVNNCVETVSFGDFYNTPSLVF